MGQTTGHNLHYPEGGDPPDVPKDMKQLADTVEAALNKIDNDIRQLMLPIPVVKELTDRWNLPSTLSSLPGIDFHGSGPKSGTWTISVPSSKFAELARSGGIILHRHGSSASDYGYATSAKLVLNYRS